MQFVKAYKSTGGQIEMDKDRAFAWEFVHKLKTNPEPPYDSSRISFYIALWIIENKEMIENFFKEMDDHE